MKMLTVIALVLGLNLAVQAEKKVEENATIIISSNESVKFEGFMNSKAKNFVTKNSNDWKTFTSVINTYTSSTSKFMKMTEEEKQNFLAASSNISNKLSKMKRKNAQEWMKKINTISSIYKFVWSNKMVYNGLEELPEVPVLASQPSI
jgi:hypothetical protein